MSHSTILIPSDSVRESVRSSPSLAILSDKKAEVMTIPVVLPKTLQHLLYSPATNPGYPGRLVAGDTFPGRHVARDKWNGIARMGFIPGRHSRATSPGPHSFSQTIKCHGGRYSRATCRPGYKN
ncbi:hypothetical protein Tco_0618254 [Tanacetum coccineum]